LVLVVLVALVDQEDQMVFREQIHRLVLLAPLLVEDLVVDMVKVHQQVQVVQVEVPVAEVIHLILQQVER
jgi:hypothetical protein